MEQEKNNNPQKPEKTEVAGGTHIKDIHPALEPKCDERARSGESGEGDRTDTDEMHRVSRG